MKFLTFFLLFISGLSAQPTAVQDQTSVKILTPDFSERQTLKLRLENGLEAIIISDPRSDLSAAVLTVGVGSWNDPAEYPGIAHFLEHMLFMGNSKYPEENEYGRYISENGGMSNAFTAPTQTSFMFSVDNSAFEGALDRFSNFFKEPLFNPSGVGRELNAIDQEYAQFLNNDGVRTYFVLKTLTNEKHPHSLFSIGNSSTLSKVSQATLKSWYEKNYSSDMMRLWVYSSLPIEKLKELVTEDFSGVPNRNLALQANPDVIFSPNAYGKIVYVTPLSQKQTLSLVWELPNEFASMYTTKPYDILCFILGHEGKTSLLSELKREELAEGLGCGADRISDKKVLFNVEVQLTTKGVKELNTVIERVYQTIALLREKGIPSYIFDDVKNLQTLRYEFQAREPLFETAYETAQSMMNEKLETYPEHTKIVQGFDPKAIRDMIQYLTPSHMMVVLSAPPEVTGIQTDKVEPWMHTPYTVKALDRAAIRSWEQAQPNPQIAIPTSNPFIPENVKTLSSYEAYQGIPTPSLVMDDEFGKIYASTDAYYLLPKVWWKLEIKTPAVFDGNAQKVAMTELFIKAVENSLADLSYDAKLADLNYEIERTARGIEITLEGFSDKADQLLKSILEALKAPINESSFNLAKEYLTREYDHLLKESPLKEGADYLKDILYKHHTTYRQKNAVLPKIDYTLFKEFYTHLFDEIYVEGMLYGSMTDAEAKDVGQKIKETLKSAPFSKAHQTPIEVIELSAKKGPFSIEKNVTSKGNAAFLLLEAANYSLAERGAQQILSQAIREAFFNELRTKQQTGYIAHAAGEMVEKHLFNYFVVQSNTHMPQDLLYRFELFLESFLRELELTEIPKERFEIIKNTLIHTLSVPPKNINEMGEALQSMAFKQDGDFDYITKRIEALQNLSYDDFVTFVRNLLSRSNKRRVGLLINGEIPQENLFRFTPLQSIQELKKQSTYSAPAKSKKISVRNKRANRRNSRV